MSINNVIIVEYKEEERNESDKGTSMYFIPNNEQKKEAKVWKRTIFPEGCHGVELYLGDIFWIIQCTSVGFRFCQLLWEPSKCCRDSKLLHHVLQILPIENDLVLWFVCCSFCFCRKISRMQHSLELVI